MSDAALVAALFVFGLIIGSFLNVVIWRVPRGESLNHPGSHCPRCGNSIRPWDNIPVVSWVILRGRCRDCHEAISVRYPLVELVTGAAFAVTGWLVGPSLLLLPMLWFVAACIALAMIDIDVRKLPNAIVLTSWLVVGGGMLLTAAVDGLWGDLGRAILAGGVMGACYLLLAVLFPAGMGMGDVKLAVLLGLALGWFGWQQVLVGFFGGFVLGAVWGLLLMAFRGAGRKTALAFGPFMIAGAAVALIWGDRLASWYSNALL
ncbi:MAG: prepilin peptidase [Candidatus Nanopelagicales bacterium]